MSGVETNKKLGDELPVGWTLVSMQDVAAWGSGGTPSRKNAAYYDGSIPWIKTGELDAGVILDTEEKLTEEGLKNSSAKVFPKGSVAVAMYGATIGKASILGIPAATNQACAVGVPNESLTSAQYLFHYLRSQKEAFIAAGKGGAQPNISQGVIKEWPLPLAPLAEQKRIADKLEAVLGRVDACRTRLDRVPDLLKRFRQSVLAAATSGKLTEDWREENEMLNEVFSSAAIGDDLEELPIGWSWTTPEKIKKVERYSLAIGPFGSNLKVSDYRENGVPLVFVREIRSRSFGGSKTKFVTEEKAEELKAHSAAGGDLLITKMGDPPGDVAVYPPDAPDSIITADCIKLRVDPQKAITAFVGYVIESPQARARLLEIVAGVAQQKISLERFRDFSLPLAPLAEQTEIVRRVEALFALADQIEARLTEARAQVERLTPATLAKAFRGELVPQDLNDEPASVLLERLRQQTPAPAVKSNGTRGRRVARQAVAPLASSVAISQPVADEDSELPGLEPTQPQTSENNPEAPPASTAQVRGTAAAPTVPKTQATPSAISEERINVEDLHKEDLMSLLREVLLEHGPCDRDTAIQQAAHALGYKRTGSVVSPILDNAIRTAVRRRVLFKEAGELRVNRASIADMEAEDRPFMKAQFLAAISQGCRTWTEREDAARLFANWFGYRRTGHQIQDRVKSLINGLIRDQSLETDGSYIRRI